MINNKAEMDQALAQVRDTLPALWWALHAGMLEKGFSTEQAMRLLEVHIYSSSGIPGTAFKSSVPDGKKEE